MAVILKSTSQLLFVYYLSLWSFWPVFAVQSSPQVAEKSQVVLVEVPVQVVRRNEAVPGLTAENFEIYDNGIRQKITRFEIYQSQTISAQEDATPTHEASSETGRAQAPQFTRHYLLLFDLFFASRPSLLKAVSAAKDWLQNDLGPHDKVGLATFAPNSGIRFQVDFTHNLPEMLSALNILEHLLMRKDVQALLQQHAQRTGKGLIAPDGQFGFPIRALTDLALQALKSHHRGDMQGAFIAKQLARMAFMKKLGTPRAATNGVLDLAYDIAAYANMHQSQDGPKYLLLFSEGFSNNILYTEAWGHMVQRHLEQMTSILLLTGWHIHTLDIKGLRPGGADPNTDGLNYMASETGGRHYRNFNDLGKAMQRLNLNTAVTYVLAYQPSNLELDGAYHRIRVKLKGARGSLQSIREGYYAPSPNAGEQQRPGLDSLRKADLLLGKGVGGPIPLHMLGIPKTWDSEVVKVRVLLQLDPSYFQAKPDPDFLSFEIYTLARDPKGDTPDFLTKMVTISNDQDLATLKEKGMTYIGEMQLPHGNFRLRALLNDRGGEDFGVAEAQVKMPDFQLLQPFLFAPMVMSDPAEVFVVNDTDEKLPFVVRGRNYMPQSLTQLVPGVATQLYFTYASGQDGPFRLGFRLQDAKGNILEGAQFKPMRTFEQAGTSGPITQMVTVNLPTTTQPGDYILTTTLEDARGKPLAQTTQTLRIEAKQTAR